MFAASTYEEIVARERAADTRQVVVFLFVKPTTQANKEIIEEFEYIHYNSEEYCSIYAIGYTNDPNNDRDSSRYVNAMCNSYWFFNNKAFVDFKKKLEDRIKWKYSGETEVLILQNNPGGSDPLNFQNYVALNVDKGLREGYIDSFPLLMEEIVRSAKSKVTATELIADVNNSRIKPKDIVSDAIKECTKVPYPIRKIVRDRLFYRSANNY